MSQRKITSTEEAVVLMTAVLAGAEGCGAAMPGTEVQVWAETGSVVSATVAPEQTAVINSLRDMRMGLLPRKW